MVDYCEWTEEHEGDYWETDCGQCFQFTAEGPDENKFQYCPYCGLPIK